MRRRLHTILSWAILCVGVLLTLCGLWAIGAYVWGVLDVLDEADQSWIFWGLAILFIGIMALGTGVGLVVLGRQMLGNARSGNP